jgi:hypothetical protein
VIRHPIWAPASERADVAAQPRCSGVLVGWEPFGGIVSEHIAQRGEGVGDIAAGLLRGLKRARGHRTRKINIDIQLDLKVVKAAFDGIVLVIDEIDRVADVEGILGNHRPRTEIAPS